MIHKVWREEYEGLTTGLELPVRGDIVNGHRHSLMDVEERLGKLEERAGFYVGVADVLTSKVRELEKKLVLLSAAVEGLINEKERKD